MGSDGDGRENGWRKVVYGGSQRGYPDNYTDGSFLEGMVTNASVVRRDLWETVLDSVVISQHLGAVATVASVWALALQGNVDSGTLLTMDALLLGLGTAAFAASTNKKIMFIIFRLAFFISGLYVMTPIFHTLTRSISSDSIYATTSALLLLHLFFRDYSSSSSSKGAAANISLHASIVASVLVASRLPSRSLVFATMLFSLDFFLLFTYVSNAVRSVSRHIHLILSALLVTSAAVLLLRLSSAAATLYVAAQITVTLLCPLCLVRIQRYKFEIQGPWDEAKLCFDIVE